MRLVQAMVRAAVGRDGSLARWCFGRVHFACGLKCARDLDTEVALYRRARLCRVMLNKMLWPPVHRSGWLRMNAQTLPSAGPHAELTPPCATSRRTAANLRG